MYRKLTSENHISNAAFCFVFGFYLLYGMLLCGMVSGMLCVCKGDFVIVVSTVFIPMAIDYYRCYYY